MKVEYVGHSNLECRGNIYTRMHSVTLKSPNTKVEKKWNKYPDLLSLSLSTASLGHNHLIPVTSDSGVGVLFIQCSEHQIL